MCIKKLLRDHQIPPDLVVKQAHFTFRGNPGKGSYLPLCDFYTYDDKLNVGQCFQLVEHVLFNKRTDDFFVDCNGTREADCFTYQPLDAGAEGQVVISNTSREDFAGRVFLLRHFSDVAAPAIAAAIPTQNEVDRANNSRRTSSFRGPKIQVNTPPVLVSYAYQSQCCCALLPVELYNSSSSQIRATSA